MFQIIILTLVALWALWSMARFIIKSLRGGYSACHGSTDKTMCQACLQAQQYRLPRR